MKALPHGYASRAPAPVSGPSPRCAPAQQHFDGTPGDLKRVEGPLSGKRARPRFPRSSKLLRHADFQRVYKQGRRHFAAHMTVFYLRRDMAAGLPAAGSFPGNGPRVGLTVGRVLGDAVERNRIKRRLREAVRHNLASLTRAVDVVINPKKSAQTAEFSILKDELARAFQVIEEKEIRRGQD